MATKRMKFRAHEESNFELQITALIDTLVIILLFMLKSFSTESLELEGVKNLAIPSITDGKSVGDGGRLSITSNEIAWNGVPYITYENFTLPAGGVKGSAELSSAIAQTAKQEKDANTFTGKIFLQADKATPVPVLQTALRIAKANGYKDIQFVGAKYN